uniref:Uncharacterized protein n=1 Tax=Amphimedon queenslandica TaxID=400682 RepID=A0A1X7UZU4_AMPQE
MKRGDISGQKRRYGGVRCHVTVTEGMDWTHQWYLAPALTLHFTVYHFVVLLAMLLADPLLSLEENFEPLLDLEDDASLSSGNTNTCFYVVISSGQLLQSFCKRLTAVSSLRLTPSHKLT